jgi:hypothetical protein
MPHPRIPEKAIKSLLARNKRDSKKKKQKKTRPSQEDRGSHHEPAYYVMFHQDSATGVHRSSETHKGDMWEHPLILGKFMGDGGMSRSPTLKLKKIYKY